MTAISGKGRRKLPRQIDICGVIYSVRQEKNPNADEKAALGYCLPRRQEIVIKSGQTEQSRDSTLLHEIIEAVNVIYCLNLRHRQIELLEVGLYQALKTNRIKFG